MRSVASNRERGWRGVLVLLTGREQFPHTGCRVQHPQIRRHALPLHHAAELVQAVQRAELSEFVARLPQGLDTRVGERGYALSGGQRQRVSIARAFLRDAPILVLDEATSHLDALSEQAVHRALKELMQNRTTLVIAHRLATVRDADRIVVMSGGRLLEQGTHRELLEKRAAYAQLLHYQMTSGEVADGALAG